MSSEHAPTISPSTVAATAPSKPRAGRSVPGPRGPLSGLPLIRKPIPFIEKLFREYGDVVSARFLNFPVYIVAHPEGVKHVLQENHRNYTKSRDYVILARLLGQGLVTSEGSIWLAQRRLMQPMFHHQKIAAFGTTMTDCTLGMLDRWSGIAGRHEPVDVTSEMMRLTLEIVGRALLTMDLTSQADTIGRTMTTANERFGQFDIGMLRRACRRGRISVPQGAPAMLQRIVGEHDREAATRKQGYGDLLSMLLAARDEETGEAMSDKSCATKR